MVGWSKAPTIRRMLRWAVGCALAGTSGVVLGATPISLPPDEAASDWADALRLADLAPGERVADGPGVVVLDAGSRWQLVVHDRVGERHALWVGRPDSAVARRELAQLAVSLLSPVDLGFALAPVNREAAPAASREGPRHHPVADPLPSPVQRVPQEVGARTSSPPEPGRSLAAAGSGARAGSQTPIRPLAAVSALGAAPEPASGGASAERVPAVSPAGVDGEVSEPTPPGSRPAGVAVMATVPVEVARVAGRGESPRALGAIRGPMTGPPTPALGRAEGRSEGPRDDPRVVWGEVQAVVHLRTDVDWAPGITGRGGARWGIWEGWIGAAVAAASHVEVGGVGHNVGQKSVWTGGGYGGAVRAHLLAGAVRHEFRNRADPVTPIWAAAFGGELSGGDAGMWGHRVAPFVRGVRSMRSIELAVNGVDQGQMSPWQVDAGVALRFRDQKR